MLRKRLFAKTTLEDDLQVDGAAVTRFYSNRRSTGHRKVNDKMLQAPVWGRPSWQRSTWQSGTEAGLEATAGLFPLWSTRQVSRQSSLGAPGGMLLHGRAWEAWRPAALVLSPPHYVLKPMEPSGGPWHPRAAVRALSAAPSRAAPLVCRSTICRDGADWD